MDGDKTRTELARELGKGAVDYLAPLAAADQARLLEDIRATRERQKTALDGAINEGMRLVPALLRGPLKRILFP